MRAVPTKPLDLCVQLVREWRLVRRADAPLYDIRVSDDYAKADFLIAKLQEFCQSYQHFYPETMRVGGAHGRCPKLFRAAVATVHNALSKGEHWHTHKRGSDVQVLQQMANLAGEQAALEPDEKLRRVRQVLFLYLIYRIKNFSAMQVSKPGLVFDFVERLLMTSVKQPMFGVRSSGPLSYEKALEMDLAAGTANTGYNTKCYDEQLAFVGGFDFKRADRESEKAVIALRAKYKALKQLLRKDPLQLSVCMTRVMTTGRILDDVPLAAAQRAASPAPAK